MSIFDPKLVLEDKLKYHGWIRLGDYGYKNHPFGIHLNAINDKATIHKITESGDVVELGEVTVQELLDMEFFDEVLMELLL